MKELDISSNSEEDTVVALERETVRELAQMLSLYRWNTAATILGAIATSASLVMIVLVLVLK